MGAAVNIDKPPRVAELSAADPIADNARKALAVGAASLEHNRIPSELGEVEALHQLRVATRRLRACVELFAGSLYASKVNLYKRDLPWVAAQAGAARECDVIAALLQARAAKMDIASPDLIAPMIEALAVRRADEHRKLCALLRSRRYRNLIAKLHAPALKKTAAVVKLGDAAASAVRPIARSAMRMGAKVAPDASSTVFHKLRVRVKRLRYALEMLSALGGKRHRKVLSRLEDLQEALGLCNDADVAIGWLRSYAETSGAPPRTILAAGALTQAIAVREQKFRRRSIKGWRRLDRSGAIGEAIEEIRKNGRLAAAVEIQPDSSSEETSNIASPDRNLEPAPQTESTGTSETTGV